MRNRYYRLPPISTAYIGRQDYFLLFETTLYHKDNFKSYIFIDPIEVIKIKDGQGVKKAFGKIQRYSKRYYLAGYFSYELGYCFEKALSRQAPRSYLRPLIHLCVFDQAICFNHKTNRFNLNIAGLIDAREEKKDYLVKDLKLNYSKPEYVNKIRRIKEYIRSGDTYQVNFTAKYHFGFSGSAFSLYGDLKNRQNVYYSSFCKFKDEFVISLSPELYFKREGLSILCRPMKGTIKRGINSGEDKEMASRLKNSIKDLAENIMIVDLIRNDLGSVSRPGSVKVSRLYDIEKYNTLFQMTSSVMSFLKKDITYFDIFRHIFPGGSVTGAPKIRTMQIIRELEDEYRNVYCGALGIIFPRNKAIFNMPIRTISLVKNKGEMGVGSGIVFDSDPEKEFEECILKARFLTQRYKPFQLIETILWQGKFVFLNEHLKRLKDSAVYFAFSFDAQEIKKQLTAIERNFKHNSRYRVRLLLSREGDIKIEYSDIPKQDLLGKRYIAVSKYKTDPGNIFLYHKTTNRSLYDSEYQHYSREGYFDVIFLNNRGEITEGAISNIIIRMNKKYYTPSLSSGLLAGIYRAYFIKTHNVQEKIIYLDDLRKAEKIFLCNSVRGLIEVNPVRKDGAFTPSFL